ncbi:MAG: chromosome segregation protein SMC, partial [Ruminococcus sp.]|nr:chromosome segregation protein SMC [Ruminococcus sp.]
MYLKSLEIQGFKSFPDKISLDFDKGLTAVVGPNGSGKSNIGDSVRWVLGEQSTKTLRGNKMEDVIFSGTVTRKPMGFAAVTLNIDNTDNTLDGYGDEVAVTRKLYRSGESEYRINGRLCRLKDINELFMDTGLGRDGYSIIGQGRIAEIVGAKSSERRDIFEEAAGISKFRYKKLEAERRLTAAQENLVRLNDIVSELESRIEPLRIQSEKAQKFIKLAEERKQLEISVWITRLDEIKQKLFKLDEQILADRGEYENTENDIAREEERFQQSYRKMQECTMKSDELRRRMIEEEQLSSQKRADIAVCENDIQHCSEAVRTAKKNIEESEKNIQDLQFRTDEIRKKIEKLQRKRKELQYGISETSDKSIKAEEQNRILGEEAGRITDKINQLHIRQSELGFAAESARKIATDAENRLRELIEGSSDVENTIAEYSRRAAENTEQLEKNKKDSGELKNKLKETEQLYSSKRSSFEQAKAEFERLLYELKNIQQRRKILVELENSMEGFAGSVKQILKAAKQGRLTGIYGTVAQNISVESKFALAIETALGGAVQHIIVENEECAKRGIQFLKEQKGGRATFLPVTSVRGYELRENGLENCAGFISTASRIAGYDPKFSSIINSLLGRTVIAEDIDSATLIAKKYGYKFRIVTLDGQVINAGGSFTGGSAQRSAGIITRKNEIESIDKETERLASLRDNLNG